jgi:uncharacterized protein YkwD
MRTQPLAVALVAAALLLPTAQAVAQSSSSSSPARAEQRGTVRPRADRFEAKVIRLTNARRHDHDRKPLQASPCADTFAEPWTHHLAKVQKLVHQSLDPFLKCPHTSWAGENIAYGYETPRALVRGWMQSPGHRANILSRHFDRIGVAAWRAANGQTYATQDFLGN